jgi:2-polyprenyl-3-methyl-5-hydroxy-6-metoxy-1,4-benzoquinol methylase
MKTIDTKFINQSWPTAGLENVERCPYCESKERTLAFENVQDWSFYCAPGKWSYWRCTPCSTLYLNPRPTELTIGNAYTSYYTHTDESVNKKVNKYNITKLIHLIKNGYLNKTLGTKHADAVVLPSWIYGALGEIGLLPRSPFHDISRYQPGKILDIGCGSGKFLKFAKQLGWSVMGIELDENAVRAARAAGLNVIHGSFTEISNLDQQFDLIVCSHVLEHVYDPVSLISLSLLRLAPNGEFWIQWPNPCADGLTLFGANWRGLEAPRHIAIPSLAALQNLAYLVNHNYTVTDKSQHWLWSQMSMYASSKTIQKKELPTTSGMSIKALMRYLISRWKIKQCELCVVTIKR